MKKLFLILATVLTVAVSCNKDNNKSETPSNSASISFDGKTYSYDNLNAAFYYDTEDKGYNIVLTPGDIAKIITDAMSAGKDIESELEEKTEALFDIDIPESGLGKSHTLSPEFDIDTDDWSFYIEYLNNTTGDYFEYDDNFKSGTMKIDLDKETGKLSISINAVLSSDGGTDSTYVITFSGTATKCSEYIWC